MLLVLIMVLGAPVSSFAEVSASVAHDDRPTSMARASLVSGGTPKFTPERRQWDYAEFCERIRTKDEESLCLQKSQQNTGIVARNISFGAAVLSCISAIIASLSLITAFRSQRAWITPKICAINVVNNENASSDIRYRITASMSWENTGKSPATGARYYWETRLIPADGDAAKRLTKFKGTEIPMNRVVAADGEIIFPSLEITNEDVVKAFDGRHRVAFYTRVTYEDIFLPFFRHTSEACHLLVTTKEGSYPVALGKHNRLT